LDPLLYSLTKASFCGLIVDRVSINKASVPERMECQKFFLPKSKKEKDQLVIHLKLTCLKCHCDSLIKAGQWVLFPRLDYAKRLLLASI